MFFRPRNNSRQTSFPRKVAQNLYNFSDERKKTKKWSAKWNKQNKSHISNRNFFFYLFSSTTTTQHRNVRAQRQATLIAFRLSLWKKQLRQSAATKRHRSAHKSRRRTHKNVNFATWNTITLTTCSAFWHASTLPAESASKVTWQSRSLSHAQTSRVHIARNRCIRQTFSCCSKHIQMWYRNTKTLWCGACFSPILTLVGVLRPTVATLLSPRGVRHVRDFVASVQAVIYNSVIIVRLNGIRIRLVTLQGRLVIVQQDRLPVAAARIHSIVSSWNLNLNLN